MTCEICDKDHKSIDHFTETNPLEIAGIEETNVLNIAGVGVKEQVPLEIPGVKEVNNNIQSNGGVNDPTEEGGLGSGRNPEGGEQSGGGQPGPLMTFETTIVKEMLDAKLNCPCSKNKK